MVANGERSGKRGLPIEDLDGCRNAGADTAAMPEMSMVESADSRYLSPNLGKLPQVMEDLPCFRSHLPVFSMIPKFNASSRLW
jgi:hypothetical protein